MCVCVCVCVLLLIQDVLSYRASPVRWGWGVGEQAVSWYCSIGPFPGELNPGSQHHYCTKKYREDKSAQNQLRTARAGTAFLSETSTSSEPAEQDQNPYRTHEQGMTEQSRGFIN